MVLNFENEMLNSAVTFNAITNPNLIKVFSNRFWSRTKNFTIDGIVTPYYANIQDIINDSRVQVKNPFELKTEFSKTGNTKNEFDRDLTERLQDTETLLLMIVSSLFLLEKNQTYSYSKLKVFCKNKFK